VAARTLKATSNGVARRQGAGRVTISISQKVVPRLPHERDESTDVKGGEPSEVIKQAVTDLKRGLIDTDRGAQMTKVYKNL
jgi:hypothetical protein